MYTPQIKIKNPKANKRLGQHFLISYDIIEKIIGAVGLKTGQPVVEIGAGTGNLTTALAQSGSRVFALELDRRLCRFLHDELSIYENITIIQADAAKYNYGQLLKEYNSKNNQNHRFKLAANLPYYVSSPILLHLIKQRDAFELMALMLQAEFVERMLGQPGSKAYGVLSITLQYYLDMEFIAHVPADCFRPQPKVASAVIRLRPLDKPRISVCNEKMFFDVVKAAFAQRRKTIYNSLTHAPRLGLSAKIIQQALDISEIDPKQRAESIDISTFGRLADNLLSL